MKAVVVGRGRVSYGIFLLHVPSVGLQPGIRDRMGGIG